jgi:hypothetical protein
MDWTIEKRMWLRCVGTGDAIVQVLVSQRRAALAENKKGRVLNPVVAHQPDQSHGQGFFVTRSLEGCNCLLR